MEFYNLQLKTPSGKDIFMSDYKGKAILIINTATKCGFTPQFRGLEELHNTYQEKGLVVIGFPCNQFLSQEPLSNESMEETCKLNHGVSFQLTEKIEVNGDNTHPVYIYLKESLGSFLGSKIKWNFTKFLISTEGIPYKRYAPATKPKSIEKDIRKLLSI